MKARSLVRSSTTATLAAFCIGLLCAQCGGSAKTSPTGSSCNLIVNGDAEAAIGSPDGTPVPTSGWTSVGEATAIQYGASEYPALTDPGPSDRGLNFFAGGQSDPTSSLAQTINVSQYASSIDTGHVTYALSGWLGGWEDQGDSATLTVTFQDATGRALAAGSIGPVTEADRADVTGLSQRSSNGAVPSGTRTVSVVLSMIRTDGTANDGYADNLSLLFTEIAAASIGNCGTVPSGSGGALGPASGGAGGSGSGGAAGTGTINPDVQRFLDEIAKLRNNQSADLDGDGVKEYQVTVGASGVVEWQVDRDQDGVAEIIRTFDPGSQTAITSFDLNQDGTTETQETLQPAKRVIVKDSDGDGTYDWRRTDTFDWTALTVHTVIETAPNNDGAFVVASDETNPAREAKCPVPAANPNAAPCEVFPSGGANYSLGSDHIGVYTNWGATDSADGTCSSAHTEKIQRAFECAVGRVQTCLSDTNQEEFQRLGSALTAGDLHMSCGNHCPNDQAANTDRESDLAPHGDMSWNPDALDSMSEDEACSAALHEMLHWSGAPDAGAGHGAGDDLVYACGRYCGGSKGCTYSSANTPKNCGVTPQQDCVVCAGTLDEKLKCGYRTQETQGTPWPGICHAGLGCIAGQCDDVQAMGKYLCDGTLLQTSTLCCNSCPAGCNDSNDYPCSLYPAPASEDTCNTPACQ
jgi:hypothetical protein